MSYCHFDDIQLLQLLRETNEGAFEEIYSRYWKLLYTTAYNILGDKFYAQEAVQEVFISLWNRATELQVQALKPYLQQAVRFQVLKCIRAQKTDQQFYSRLADVTASIVYHNPLLFKEQETLLHHIMDDIPPDCRLVFKLSREEQLTYRQIADHLNISEKTVEKKMSICLKHIRCALEQNKMLMVLLLLFIDFIDKTA